MDRNFDFFVPQRLHPFGNIIAFVRSLLKLAKHFFFLMIYFIVKYKTIFYNPYFWLSLLILILLIAIWSYLQYRNYRYTLDEDKEEIILTQGVFNKEKTVVKFSNIIQVNIEQNLVQRILGIYGVSLDTSGSDKVEIDLYALNGQQATTLKQYLLSQIRRESSTIPIDEELPLEEQKQNNLVRLEPKNILLVSLLTNYRQGFALFLAFCGALIQNMKDTFDTLEIKEYDHYTDQIMALDVAFTYMAFGLLLIVLIPFVINLFRYLLKYYDFTIFKNDKGTFSMQYGLTNKVNTIFNKDRVQLTVFRQNQILKRLGLGILSLKQIVLEVSKEEQGSIDIPGISHQQKEAVYNLTYEENVFDRMQFFQPKVNLFISRTVKTILAYAILVPLVFVLEFDNVYSYLVLSIFFIFINLYNYLFYKSYQLGWNGKYLVKRVGVWNEKETIIAMRAIQSVAISQTFFQKRSYTSDLIISTSAKAITFSFFEREELNKITNYLLYQLEK